MGEITDDARDIPGHPGYRVSTDGRVWTCWRARGNGRGRAPTWFQSNMWKPMKITCTRGSARVNLGKGNGRFVGPLVLETFVGPRPPGHECCHFPDPDRRNCALANLRWGTSAEDTAHQRAHGTLIGGERHGMAKLSDSDIERIRLASGTQQQIADQFGISQSHVSEIRNHKKRTASSHAGRGLRDG